MDKTTIISNIISGVISGLIVLCAVLILDYLRTKSNEKKKRLQFFIERACTKTYFLNLDTLLDINVPYKNRKYSYVESLKSYKEFVILIAYLIDEPTHKVDYLKFEKVKDNGHYLYSLNFKKYEFVTQKLKKYGIPNMNVILTQDEYKQEKIRGGVNLESEQNQVSDISLSNKETEA